MFSSAKNWSSRRRKVFGKAAPAAGLFGHCGDVTSEDTTSSISGFRANTASTSDVTRASKIVSSRPGGLSQRRNHTPNHRQRRNLMVARRLNQNQGNSGQRRCGGRIPFRTRGGTVPCLLCYHRRIDRIETRRLEKGYREAGPARFRLVIRSTPKWLLTSQPGAAQRYNRLMQPFQSRFETCFGL